MCNFKMAAIWSFERVLTTDEMASKAALVGAKTVTPERPSTVSTKPVAFNASIRAVRPPNLAAAEIFTGGERTVSIKCTTTLEPSSVFKLERTLADPRFPGEYTETEAALASTVTARVELAARDGKNTFWDDAESAEGVNALVATW